MKRYLAGMLVWVAASWLAVASVGARDRLANGYSSASGVFAGLWVAQEAKLFEKYDIDSHLILIASGSMMVQAMLGGDLPIAGAAGSAAVDAALGGADIVMFGSMVKVPASRFASSRTRWPMCS